MVGKSTNVVNYVQTHDQVLKDAVSKKTYNSLRGPLGTMFNEEEKAKLSDPIMKKRAIAFVTGIERFFDAVTVLSDEHQMEVNLLQKHVINAAGLHDSLRSKMKIWPNVTLQSLTKLQETIDAGYGLPRLIDDHQFYLVACVIQIVQGLCKFHKDNIAVLNYILENDHIFRAMGKRLYPATIATKTKNIVEDKLSAGYDSREFMKRILIRKAINTITFAMVEDATPLTQVPESLEKLFEAGVTDENGNNNLSPEEDFDLPDISGDERSLAGFYLKVMNGMDIVDTKRIFSQNYQLPKTGDLKSPDYFWFNDFNTFKELLKQEPSIEPKRNDEKPNVALRITKRGNESENQNQRKKFRNDFQSEPKLSDKKTVLELSSVPNQPSGFVNFNKSDGPQAQLNFMQPRTEEQMRAQAFAEYKKLPPHQQQAVYNHSSFKGEFKKFKPFRINWK